MAALFVPLAISLAGSLLNTLFGPKVKGLGRLDSLNIPSVSPGNPIIKTYGTMKVDGQLIFSSQLIETEHSGKGGGKSQPYYTYAVDCAVAACQGPINSILRIRANQKLLWVNPSITPAEEQEAFDNAYQAEAQYLITNGLDFDDACVSAFFFAFNNYSIDNTTPSTQNDAYNYIMSHAVNGQLPNSDNVGSLLARMFANFDLSKSYQTYTQRYDSLTVYNGSELQQPDAMMQSYIGVGKVPAYRGIAYISLVNLQLADFSNTIPSFQFEVQQTDGTVYLSDIITDICEDAGLTSDQLQFDHQVRTQEVSGFSITDRGSARDAINVLMQVFPLYGSESGWCLKFGWLKKTPVAIVNRGDFGAHLLDEEAPPSEEVTLANPYELPQQITLKYQDPDRNYSTNHVDVLKQVTVSKLIEDVTVPIAMTQADALSFIQDMMTRRYLGRRSYKLVLPRKYAILEAGDAFLVPDQFNPNQYYALFIQEYNLGANGMIELTCCDFFSADYIEPQTDTYLSVSSEVGQTPPQASPTFAYMMDLPLLTDSEDDNVGFYAALGGNSSGWEGGALLLDFGGNGEVQAFGITSSVDSSGSTWYSLMTSTVGIANGYALSALPPAVPWVWDLENSLTVMLYDPNFILSSYTQADCVAKPVNVFLVGEEIIQAASVQSLGKGVFVLSKLLRGLRGTDYAVGNHSKGEVFVQLDSSSYQRITHAQNQLNVANSYRSLTIGDTTGESQVDFTFTDTGNSLRPYAVMLLSAYRDDASNVTLTWLPRARQNGGLIDGSETVLDQATEAYSIDVMNGTSVVRTVSLGAVRTWTYEASDATADFGSLPTSVTFMIYEVGAIIGRGFPLEVTV